MRYRITTTAGDVVQVDNPTRFPNPSEIVKIEDRQRPLAGAGLPGLGLDRLGMIGMSGVFLSYSRPNRDLALQVAGAVRPDTDLSEIIQMVGGIAKIQGVEPAQIEHILDIALDGLRYRA